MLTGCVHSDLPLQQWHAVKTSVDKKCISYRRLF